MSHALDYVVLAEGVETAEQRDFIKELGCDFAQGYYFSKPMPVEELNQLLYPS